MAKALFITGTGTDVGKTYLSGLIVKKLTDSGRKAGYYKAAMSGNVRRPDQSLIPGDGQHVKEVSGIDQPLDTMCPYVYETAVSPHLASRLEGNPVRMKVVREGFENICSKYDYITMEGSGGILCPLSFDESRIWLTDVIQDFGLSCLLAADAGLGTINSVLLTVEYMRQKKIPVKGILLNHFHPGNVMEEDNLRMCENLTRIPVLACVQEGDTELPMDADTLAALYE